MKLNKEQIKFISEYLDRCQLKQIDVKLELLDHIASQVEDLIDEENVAFEEALKKVMVNWYSLLKDERSFHVGLIYSFPKIVMNKLERRIKKTYLYWLLIIVCLAFLSLVFKIDFLKNQSLNLFLDYINSFILGCVLIILFLINFKPKPTTYRFLVNHSSPILIFLFVINLGFNSIKLYLITFVFIQFTFMIFNFYKHFECLKRYQLI